MANGWPSLMQDQKAFLGEGHYPLPAYSEFMPPPRLGVRPYRGEPDKTLFSDDDAFGWRVSELEEEYELAPGLEHLAKQIHEHVVSLGVDKTAHPIAGHQGRNLKDNPYWAPELEERAGKLAHERHVLILPLAFSRTQDDLGRVRWTFFGGSEQGPEQAFWKSFYTEPGKELPEHEGTRFVAELLAGAYGEEVDDAEGLERIGFRILPSKGNERFPYWDARELPTWAKRYLRDDESKFEHARYLLTFRPFAELPQKVREKYLAGQLSLLPTPASLAFWGMPNYIQLQAEMPLAMQLGLLRLVARHDARVGVRVPQSGWLNQPKQGEAAAEVEERLLLNSYKRTSRWMRVPRYDDPEAVSQKIDPVTRTLFSTDLDAIDLYDKPMARNAQVWAPEMKMLLNGPLATRAEIDEAAKRVLEGGAFRYRFLFPAMRVGRHEVYWQRPLVAYKSPHGELKVMANAPTGYLTAYPFDAVDPANPVELWPRLERREAYLSALKDFDDEAHDWYLHQTPLNLITLFDISQVLEGARLSRPFAEQLIRRNKHMPFERWLDSLAKKTHTRGEAKKMQNAVRRILQPLRAKDVLPQALTYGETATRAFEEGLWNDIAFLSNGHYLTKDNADVVRDPVTEKEVKHTHRDLHELGDYLIKRHQKAIDEAGMTGKALVGDLPFQWRTDFDYTYFGGWRSNQSGDERERNLLVMIPGKDRTRAVIMADHYDTAYMEDVYDKKRGGSGARLAAAGADDNASASAALLQAAPVFLKMAKAGRLEHDVWLVHLTGEEFPSDCLGARDLCEKLVEGTLKLRLSQDESKDLSGVQIEGVYVLDMVAHNRDDDLDTFQISPGKSTESLELAREAHIATRIWNASAPKWNRGADRRGTTRGKRSRNGNKIPKIAKHPKLNGEVRTFDDPMSSLYNTDGIIFSDVGVPVVLFMENYDLNRSGYHDSKDTMMNIDLDYGAAVVAIAIESVARVANRPPSPLPSPSGRGRKK